MDLFKKLGENLKLDCNYCHEKSEYHIDSISAENSTFGEILKSKIIVHSIISITMICIGLFFGGIVAALVGGILGSIISILFSKSNDSKKNIEFNKHKIRGRVSGIGFGR
ncbi:hypothetical protein NH26_19930 [Flammeovirga pacifica]|uniref:Uncharacterized protein n=2 Tax=Flammeovirga pacifica TaxID=915059 RepID=A0A1S1YS87_FLAPC|nr:hypothetical protein NH26_19930 [Flammeovirga pacifica]